MMKFCDDDLINKLNFHVINDEDKNFIYGTAGFRTEGKRLYGIAFRVGIMAVLRSMKENGAVIGVMVTASHNKASDNGLKVIDKGGEMLNENWEEIAVQLTRLENAKVPNFIRKIVHDFHIDSRVQGSVFLGKDTRLTSKKIASVVMEGVSSIQGVFIDFGLVTTPQLHFLVLKQNTLNPNAISYLPDNLEIYFNQLCNSYKQLIQQTHNITSKPTPLYIDCSNGIGAIHMKKLQNNLHPLLDYIVICNSLYSEGNKINLNCGADFIKSKNKFPIIHNGIESGIQEDQRWASIDGDADRLLYFYKDEKKNLCLLDGDRQSVLISEYIKHQLDSLNDHEVHELSVGVVQTAYANKSCTDTLVNTVGLPVVCVPTGVKYLHHVAHQLDIRIYFETNGHGSILLSNNAKICLTNALVNKPHHPLRLILLDGIINEAVGDSFSILLLLEFILNYNSPITSLTKWYSQYKNWPHCLLQVSIADRRVIATEDNERRVSRPAALQVAINQLLDKLAPRSYGKTDNLLARVFVRPSGTEDIVRVYCEAFGQQDVCDCIALETARLVYDMVGGTGVRP